MFVTCGATGVVCCELLATDGVALDATDVADVARSLAVGVEVTALSCLELLVFVASVTYESTFKSIYPYFNYALNNNFLNLFTFAISIVQDYFLTD